MLFRFHELYVEYELVLSKTKIEFSRLFIFQLNIVSSLEILLMASTKLNQSSAIVFHPVFIFTDR
ncbi:hypothetical protein HOF65_02870 [bacterium]|nr:hypothetical protein [bacterium]MBT3852940.1 hypothetical protein [bacterium]MBT4632481.1 hypothetical protein [bacterium]MBT6778723.1 hypothetical protein [bacterium]